MAFGNMMTDARDDVRNAVGNAENGIENIAGDVKERCSKYGRKYRKYGYK